jgi:uncharacterized BrkB/YihY/UPF0761 family membrane protein
MSSSSQDPLTSLAKSLSYESLGNYIQAVNKRYQEHKAEYVLRSWAWYFLIPLALFLVFAPGLVLSVPSVQDCNDGVTKPIAPGRINIYNSLVAVFVFYFIILLIVYGLGGLWGIDPPFQQNIIAKYASAITK